MSSDLYRLAKSAYDSGKGEQKRIDERMNKAQALKLYIFVCGKIKEYMSEGAIEIELPEFDKTVLMLVVNLLENDGFNAFYVFNDNEDVTNVFSVNRYINKACTIGVRWDN